MEELLEKLKEWKSNVDCDIKADWYTIEEKSEWIMQSAKLSMALGLLQDLGINNNIPK